MLKLDFFFPHPPHTPDHALSDFFSEFKPQNCAEMGELWMSKFYETS